MKEARKLSVAILMTYLTLMSGLSPAQDPTCQHPVPATDPKFMPGQVWTFKGRSFEPAARLTILRVETLPKVGEIIHVRIDGIRLRNCSGGAEPETIEHAPFTRDAIERSAVTLLHADSVPFFEDGYNYWAKHCGGAYKITVAEMVVADEKTFNAQSHCTIS